MNYKIKAMKTLIVGTFFCFLFFVGCKEIDKSKNIDADITTAKAPPKLSASEEKQQAQLKIIPIEHATVVLEWNGITLYIDPVGGAAAFEGQKAPDLILITDIHGDHLSVETLQALDTQKAKIIVPQAVADKILDVQRSAME